MIDAVETEDFFDIGSDSEFDPDKTIERNDFQIYPTNLFHNHFFAHVRCHSMLLPFDRGLGNPFVTPQIPLKGLYLRNPVNHAAVRDGRCNLYEFKT